ncbi:hypothetical protein DFH06DRAFT_1183057 [Mycena polygramma]|nr:hypothetical protein DFH06DRAFT_1183057 [Mycena polygramma]
MATISPDAGEHSPVTPSEDFEPDEEWKENQRQLIEHGFTDMIQEAKDRLERKIQSIQGMEDGDEEERQRALLFDEFQAEKAAIKTLAKEEFLHALARERLMRRLRTDLPIRATTHHQSLRLELEQEQAATLKAATLEGGALQNDANHDVEAAFQDLLHIDPGPSSLDDDPLTPDSEEDPEFHKGEDAGKADMGMGMGIDPHAGALTIKITRLPAEPPANGNVGWVKASDAARAYERQRANSRTEAARPPPAPVQPVKKWVSASDAARRTQRRIES